MKGSLGNEIQVKVRVCDCSKRLRNPLPSINHIQVIWLMRHGDRLDNFDPEWRQNAKHVEDTPLSPIGHQQAIEVHL